MKRQKLSGPRVKSGTSKNASIDRKSRFIEAYLANNQNGTQAAITAGYSPKTAHAAASRLLKDVNLRERLAMRAKQTDQISGLDPERTKIALARRAYGDIRNLYLSDGSLKPISAMTDEEAALLASVETDELRSDDKVIGTTSKIKVVDQLRALDMAMRHHGLYDKDSAQRAVPIKITVVYE